MSEREYNELEHLHGRNATVGEYKVEIAEYHDIDDPSDIMWFVDVFKNGKEVRTRGKGPFIEPQAALDFYFEEIDRLTEIEFGKPARGELVRKSPRGEVVGKVSFKGTGLVDAVFIAEGTFERLGFARDGRDEDGSYLEWRGARFYNYPYMAQYMIDSWNSSHPSKPRLVATHVSDPIAIEHAMEQEEESE